MYLSPLLEAPLAIQIHVASVLPAAVLGPVLFLRRKGTSSHRLLGKIWLGLMVVAALSSFFIHSINLFYGFSPIHLVSIYVLVGSWLAIKAASEHRISAHKRQVSGLYAGGILGAGAFTLLPGRIMHEVFFRYDAGWPDMQRLALFVAVMIGITAMLFVGVRLSSSLERI